MDTMIELPFGGPGASFDAHVLRKHILDTGRMHIIQGQQNCSLKSHTKPNSLDVWLRKNFAQNSDTKQATNEVIEQLVKTEVFCEGKFKCPDSGRTCKGIEVSTQ